MERRSRSMPKSFFFVEMSPDRSHKVRDAARSTSLPQEFFSPELSEDMDPFLQQHAIPTMTPSCTCDRLVVVRQVLQHVDEIAVLFACGESSGSVKD
jgi:hypothetical protein